MKAKLKFDKQAMADFFLHHAEKIVLGLIAVSFLALVYFAVVRPVYSKNPEDLQDSAKNTRTYIERTEAKVGDLPVENYPEKAKRGQQPLNVEGYSAASLWNPPVFPKPHKRDNPVLMVVQKLVGNFDRGPFVLKGAAPAGGASHDAPGEAPHGQRWVVLTGLVPLAQQIEAYNDAFKDMRRPEDTPSYLVYSVERAEVTGDAADANPAWKAVETGSMDSYKQAVSQWAGTIQELVPGRYLLAEQPQRLVFPLGPLSGRNWDDRVAHLPEIPLGAGKDSERSEAAPPPSQSGSEAPQIGLPPQDGTVPIVAPKTTNDAGAAAGAQPPKYLLFRYFDFSVEPQKRYQYRVRLALTNPNFGVESRYLIAADSAKNRYNWTAWSDPTTVVVAPRDDRLLALGVKPAPRSSAEPDATVMIVKWQAEQGGYVSEKFPKNEGAPKVLRGQLLNYSAEHVDYHTDSLLLDMRGGERFPDRVHGVAPAEILIWDPEKNLVVQSDAEDKPQVELATGAPAASAATGNHGAAAAPAAPSAKPAETPSSGGLFGEDAGSDKKPGHK